MPAEPENNMDAPLRAYAEARRQAAGEPLEMHPATRQMLQGEVARTLGQPAAPEPRRGVWTGFWLRLATAGGLAAAACVALIVMFRDGGRMESQLAYAPPATTTSSMLKDESAVASTPAPASAPAGQAAPAMDAMAPVERDRYEAVKSLEAKAEKTTLAGPAQVAGGLMPEEQRRKQQVEPPALALADRADSRVMAGAAGAAPSTPPPAPTLPAPAVAAAVAEKKLALVTKREEGGAGARFVQVAQSQNFRRNVNSPPPVNVLNDFQFEQTGQEVRIVDTDGSVYVGTVIEGDVSSRDAAQGLSALAPTSTAPSANAARKGDMLRQGRAAAELERSRAFADAAKPATAVIVPSQDVYFRVSGTNRSLNQIVEFNGRAQTQVPSSDPAKGGFRGANELAKEKLAKAAEEGAVVLRIEGRAVIGGRSQIPVEAVIQKR